MNRILLSSATATSDACTDDVYEALVDEVSHHDSDEAFSHVYYVMVFVASLWVIGKLFMKIGMPSLVGEIIFGMIMGPNLINLVGDHGSEFLVIIGEIGLILLVVEAGIDVDIGMLKLIGFRGLVIAILGSIIPLSMGFVLSLINGQSIQSSIAIGSCFAPTSMGIALNVLKKAKILNTPTGQLIIAAAILDDVIALIILSELSAMNDPTVGKILPPLIVSPVLILVIGYCAIRYIPRLIKRVMTKIPEQHHENSILGLLFVSTFLLIPACHYLGSSHLLGAFLSGLMFCTDHTIHHVFDHQIKRILHWMLRIFFACTIGFAIPIREFTSTQVLKRGAMYCIPMLGKVVTGVFGRPLNKKEFFTVGFSMSAWGEFAFIIATASYAEGTIDKESFSSILLAVLLSVIISPYILTFVIKYYEKQAQRKMDEKLAEYEDSNLHPVYFAINTKARGQWGHQDKILKEIFQLQFEIIDFRSWHAPEYNYSHHKPLTKESFYVMDTNLLLPPTMHLTAEQKKILKSKVKTIRTRLKSVLGDKAVVSIKRWLPGVLANEDKLDKKDAMLGQKVPIVNRRQSYCRREAFKQAHSIMSSLDWDYEMEKDKSEKHNKSKTLQVMPAFGLKDRTRLHSNSNHIRDLHNLSTQIRHAHSEDMQDLSGPSTIKATKSVPSKSMPSSPFENTVKKTRFVKRTQLMRQLSDPLDHTFHSGMGHGGQMKGLGALPFTSKMINIHNHFVPSDGENENGNMSPEPQTPESDASISHIYGDEDAHHHKLPEYKDKEGRNRSASKSKSQHSYIQRPTAIAEDSNEASNQSRKRNKRSTVSVADIEIITADREVNENGNESSGVYDTHYQTPTDGNEKKEHNIAITVTSFANIHSDNVYDYNTPQTTRIHNTPSHENDASDHTTPGSVEMETVPKKVYAD